MADVPGADAEAAAIHAAFAVRIFYTGAGLTSLAVDAVISDTPSEPFMGAGSTARRREYEIREGVFASNPSNGDTILDSAGSWRVIDVTRRRDVDAWVLAAERAS